MASVDGEAPETVAGQGVVWGKIGTAATRRGGGEILQAEAGSEAKVIIDRVGTAESQADDPACCRLRR